MMNNSVPTSKRGTLNGAGMTIASIGKAVGPAAGSPLFAWSLTNGLSMPFDYHLLYWLSAALMVALVLISLWLPKSLEHSPEVHRQRAEAQQNVTLEILAEQKIQEEGEEAIGKVTKHGRGP